jgi:putative transposase
MPRMLRLEFPGALAHVMARGIDGNNIFRCDEDREEFLFRLSTLLRNIGDRCLAWCFLDNHYHLLLRTTEKPLSKLMRPLNGGYARWFNKKYNRKGYLFQDRFKSVLCQEQDYAKQLIRYIHLNPLRAGEVQSLSSLKEWRWCGHAFLLGIKKTKGENFQDRMEALGRFGRTEKDAIEHYLSYLAKAVDPELVESAGALAQVENIEISGAKKGWPAVIGDPEFAQQVMLRFQENFKRKHRKADYDHVFKTLSSDVSRIYGIKQETLAMRGRIDARSEARAAFCFRAHYEELIPLSVIARFLRMTISPTERLAKRGRENLRGKR